MKTNVKKAALARASVKMQVSGNWAPGRMLLALLFLAVLPLACQKDADGPATATQPPPPVVYPNFDKLGYGYDVTGEYANVSATKFPVINVAAIYALSKDRVIIDQTSVQLQNSVAGEDALRYSRAIAAKLKISSGLGLFKASVSYFDSSNYSSDYIYSGYNLLIRQKQLKLNATIELLQQNLTPEFRSDIETQTPAFIVSKYGTHFIVDEVMGGRFEALFRARTTYSDRKAAAEAGMSVALKKLFNLDVSGGGSQSYAQYNSEERLYYRTVGGDASVSLLGDITLGPNLPTKIQLSQWQATATTDRSELIDFGPEALIPIASLIADRAKSQQVENYVKQYLIDREVKMVDAPSYVYQYYDEVKVSFAYSLEKVPVLYGRFKLMGPVFRAYPSKMYNAMPVYQYYSSTVGDFYFSGDANASIAGYQQQGIVYYAYDTQVPGTVPLYRYHYSAVINKKHYNTYYYSTSDQLPGRDWAFIGKFGFVFPL